MVLKILARLHLDLGHFLKRKVRYSPRGSLNSISQIFETVKVKLAAIINSLFPVKIQVVVLMKWTFSTAIHCFTLVMSYFSKTESKPLPKLCHRKEPYGCFVLNRIFDQN